MIIGIPSESKPHARVAGMTCMISVPQRIDTASVRSGSAI
jgi:hypothetical protein